MNDGFRRKAGSKGLLFSAIDLASEATRSKVRLTTTVLRHNDGEVSSDTVRIAGPVVSYLTRHVRRFVSLTISGKAVGPEDTVASEVTTDRRYVGLGQSVAMDELS